MATTIIKSGNSDNQLIVNSDGSINVNGGGGGGSNASVGTTGTTAPASATEIGTINPSGSLTAATSDSSGNLKTNSGGFNSISPGFPTQISVSTTSTQLFAANSARRYAHIFNNSAQPIFIQYSSSAALNQGIKINPGSFFTLDNENLWLGVINAIGLVSNQLIDVLEGV